MSRLSTRGRKAADTRPGGRRTGRRAGRGPAVAGALALALGLAPALAPQALAQSNSGITINSDVLNSLGPGLTTGPLAPLAPAAPPTPLSPRSQPYYQAPVVPPANVGKADPGLAPYDNGSMVVTRPGTLLFPPLDAPTSRLTQGFSGESDMRAARARALDNAFAEGPEPRSQLLIPLGSPGGGNDSVMVFMENLPPANPDADPSDAPVLALQAPPPQPSPPKPEVPAEVLARLQRPMFDGPATLAPEFADTELADTGFADPEVAGPEVAGPEVAGPEVAGHAAMAPDAMAPDTASADAPLADAPLADAPPAIAALPAEAAPPAPVEQSDLAAAGAEHASPEPAASTPAASVAEAPAVVDGAPVSLLPDVPVPDAPVADAPVSDAPVSDVPVPDVPVPDTRTADTTESGTVASAASDAMLSDPRPSDPLEGGIQTASLTVGGIEDMTFLFENDSAELSPEAQSDLRSLANALRSEVGSDVQVLGFASNGSGSEDRARKLALSRALKVRSFLIDEGISSARIRVRSLGDRAEGGPANRVDIKPIGS